ncbi:MAG: GNAT family N-acetyltransferase [Bacteroidaceae bacterium]|nr:GNAT family N-acetyltransferase [Bacteroidaceae bacterium]
MQNVYTNKEYRGKGLCTKLLRNIIDYAKSKGLGCIDLSATDKAYSLYKRLVFKDKEYKYQDMRLSFM